MSSCNFSFPFSGDPEAIVAKAKGVIESQNGIFTGNTSTGNFEVTLLANTVKGSYTITAQILDLTITDKPFFVPCGTIESFLRSKIS